MRKAIKLCLALAMATAITVPAYAEVTTTITGDAIGNFKQVTSKAAAEGAKSITTMDMAADGEFGVKVVSKGDTWSSAGFIELSGSTVAGVRDVWAEVSNETMAIRFGRQYPQGIAKGGDAFGAADYTIDFGENVQGGRMDVVKFSMADLGLDVWYGMNENAAVAAVDNSSDESKADVLSEEQYNTTYMGLKYGKSFGDIAVAVQYASNADSINKDNGGEEKGAKDGSTASETALAVQYTMDKMMFAFNYGTWTSKSGTAGSKSMDNSAMELAFDMALEGPVDAISAAYTTSSEDTLATGATKKYQDEGTAMAVSALIKVDMAKLYVGYATKSKKNNESGSKTATESTVGVRLAYSF